MKNPSEYKENVVPAESQEKKVRRQFVTSALGELAGFSIAIGAVYVTERLLPNQSQALISHMAQQLGRARGLSSESQQHLAKKIFDVGIMNIGGASSMAVQYGMRRSHQSPEERTPLLYELGRLGVGRMMGTTTAIGALAIAHTHTPQLLHNAERSIYINLGDSPHSRRISELLVSNSIQSVGAIAGNVPAQLLYDRIVQTPKRNISR